ncbi:MAG: hypothetical protein ACXVB0_09055 [Mucilaginibacter sp.]
MKTSLYFRIAAMLIVSLIASNSFAQQITRNDTLPTLVITAKSMVSQKVTNSFKKDFQGAVSPRWYKMDKDYMVKFVSDDQKNTALYNKKGFIVYHIVYGGENNLPAEIKDQIMTKYSGCKIITAIKINQENRSIWVVNLEMKNLLILVREEDGALAEINRYKNAAI